MMMIPQQVYDALLRADSVGIGGSRRPSQDSIDSLREVLAWIPQSSHVHVGDAQGIDKVVIETLDLTQDLTIYRSSGWEPWQLAARTRNCILGNCGPWISLPEGDYPIKLEKPSRQWVGSGSGSWSGLAFAVGRGVECFAYLSANTPSPDWLKPLGSGWFEG